MKISIFGTGYVGLVTGTCFAELGNEVHCVDVDLDKIKKLNRGEPLIYEPGLDVLVAKNVKEGRLFFTTDASQAVSLSELIFIAVGTPSGEDGSADLSYVLKVAETIGLEMSGYKIIITKSTVPVGTSLKVKETIQACLKKRKVNCDFDVVSNPEYLKEGTAVEDCLKPARVVIGCESEHARQIMKRLYEPFLRNGNPILFMDLLSSEMTKYAANSMLATKISFMNELSRLCERLGVDIENVRHGIGSDPRIGYDFIYPGLGYGGSCFPKDVKALIQMAEGLGDSLHILKAVETTNRLQRLGFIDKILQHFGRDLKGRGFAVWGLSFKPGTDDVREAPSETVITSLIKAGASVSAYDPVARGSFSACYPEISRQVEFKDSQYSVLKGADALLIFTEWKQFREPDFNRMRELLRAPVVFDGRNLYDPSHISTLGFKYYSIGRRPVGI